MTDAKAKLFAAQKPLRAPNGPESAAQRQARLSLWPDEELSALAAWLRVAQERNGEEAAQALDGLEVFSSESLNESQRALGIRSLHEALERLPPLDALWAASHARRHVGMLACQELIQRHCRGAGQTPSWEIAAQSALLDEVASARGGASVAEWASAAPGEAPERIEELADFWSLAGEKRRVEQVFNGLRWSCWASEKNGESEELISLAWERVSEWSCRGNPKKTSVEALARMSEGGFWAALAWHARNGANIDQTVWEAAVKHGVAERCAPDGEDIGDEEKARMGENIKPMGSGQKAALAALSQTEFRPKNATRFLVEALSKRKRRSWEWAGRQAEITPKAMFGLLEWWALNERDILSCEAFEWQDSERLGEGGQTAAEAKAWAQERVQILAQSSHWPAGAALAAIWEIAMERRAYLLAAAALEKGAQTSGVDRQGRPLGEAVGRGEFDQAKNIARAGGWGPQAETMILDLPEPPTTVSPATRMGQRAANTEAWRAQARSRQEARQLAAEVKTARAGALPRQFPSDEGHAFSGARRRL